MKELILFADDFVCGAFCILRTGRNCFGQWKWS